LRRGCEVATVGISTEARFGEAAFRIGGWVDSLEGSFASASFVDTEMEIAKKKNPLATDF
jgi:hypothetical protein